MHTHRYTTLAHKRSSNKTVSDSNIYTYGVDRFFLVVFLRSFCTSPQQQRTATLDLGNQSNDTIHDECLQNNGTHTQRTYIQMQIFFRLLSNFSAIIFRHMDGNISTEQISFLFVTEREGDKETIKTEVSKRRHRPTDCVTTKTTAKTTTTITK